MRINPDSDYTAKGSLVGLGRDLGVPDRYPVKPGRWEWFTESVDMGPGFFPLKTCGYRWVRDE